MKIVFGPVVAPAAWEIGEKLLPREFKIEILSSEEKRRIDQLETADFFMGFRAGLIPSDYDHLQNIKLIQVLSAFHMAAPCMSGGAGSVARFRPSAGPVSSSRDS